MRHRKRTIDHFPRRMIILSFIIFILLSWTPSFDLISGQVAPIYNDPEVSLRFDRSRYYTDLINNMNVANVSGSISCIMGANTPEGARVRINLELSDGEEFFSSKFIEFTEGGEIQKDFFFEYFISGKYIWGNSLVLTLESNWEYLHPEEGSGLLPPIVASAIIGPYGKLDSRRVQPSDPISLRSREWKTIELMVYNEGNVEIRVTIQIIENPSSLDYDLKNGFVMVGPFNEFPFTFTIRDMEDRDLDSYIVLKLMTEVDNVKISTTHRVEVQMDKSEPLFDFGGMILLLIIPFFTLVFFGVMLVFWIRLRSIKRSKNDLESEIEVEQYRPQNRF